MMEGEYISFDGGGGERIGTQANDEEGREYLSSDNGGEGSPGTQASDEGLLLGRSQCNKML